MASTFAVRALGGVISGSGLLLTYRTMGSIAQGRTDFIAYKQSSILLEVALSAISLLKDVNIISLSKSTRKWVAGLIAYPLPFALQILNHHISARENPILKNCILTARLHLEHIAFAIDLCVSVLFTYYVAPYYGMGILSGLTIELLNEAQFLPAKVKEVWEKSWIALASTQCFLKIGIMEDLDLWDIGKFLGELAIFTWETYFEKPASELTQAMLLSFDRAKALIATPLQDLLVDWSHVSVHPHLVIKGASTINIYETMEKLVNNIDWKHHNNLRTFKTKMLKDVRFQETHPLMDSIEGITDDFAKKYFTTGALLEAQQIASGYFEKGDSYIRFDILQGMLKSILKSLSDDFSSTPNDLDATDDIFRLALEGGQYCADGHVEVIENIYKKRILASKEVPLQTKVLQLLTGVRQRWFDSFYAQFAEYTNMLPKGIIDASDIHFRNVSMFYFDESLKLHSEVVKNDMTTMEGGFCSRLYRLIFSKIMEYSFWIYAISPQGPYSIDAIMQEMVQISAKDFTHFWQTWIDTSPLLKDHQRKLLSDELIDQGTLFNEPIQQRYEKVINKRKVTTMELNPKLLKLMLYEMKIAKT
jgi:hypothetical protein